MVKRFVVWWSMNAVETKPENYNRMKVVFDESYIKGKSDEEVFNLAEHECVVSVWQGGTSPKPYIHGVETDMEDAGEDGEDECFARRITINFEQPETREPCADERGIQKINKDYAPLRTLNL
jgi:hypothetical protein